MRFKSRLAPSLNLIDLTPLVDVIFLMLIFFIITSDILPLKSLNIENPTITRDSTPLTTQLFLVMDAEHVLYLGSKKSIVDFNNIGTQLRAEVAQLKKENGGIEPTVVLSIDRRVDYGNFLALFSIAQECCQKLRLVYTPAEPRSSEYF